MAASIRSRAGGGHGGEIIAGGHDCSPGIVERRPAGWGDRFRQRSAVRKHPPAAGRHSGRPAPRPGDRRRAARVGRGRRFDRRRYGRSRITPCRTHSTAKHRHVGTIERRDRSRRATAAGRACPYNRSPRRIPRTGPQSWSTGRPWLPVAAGPGRSGRLGRPGRRSPGRPDAQQHQALLGMEARAARARRRPSRWSAQCDRGARSRFCHDDQRRRAGPVCRKPVDRNVDEFRQGDNSRSPFGSAGALAGRCAAAVPPAVSTQVDATVVGQHSLRREAGRAVPRPDGGPDDRRRGALGASCVDSSDSSASTRPTSRGDGDPTRPATSP